MSLTLKNAERIEVLAKLRRELLEWVGTPRDEDRKKERND